MKPRTVLSLEQALSMTYATLRFVHLGWRVIRIEAAGPPDSYPGDPNRYIGSRVTDDDRRSYFVAPNVGKEAIALNLKSDQGRALLRDLVRELEVDVFCCNTLPGRYEQLGIDYETLSADRPELIWAGISAMGPDYPDVAGYDPMIQAMAGFMETTGFRDGPPTVSGIPVIDLKAGDEVFANVCLALADRAETGRGRRIDVSMLQAAASWLITTLPLLDFDCEPEEVTRWGNAHRKFIPTNVYPVKDGYVYVALGSDHQWRRLVALPNFASLDTPQRQTHEGRYADRHAIYKEFGNATKSYTQQGLLDEFGRAKIPAAPINTIAEVRDLAAIANKLTHTKTPDGRDVRMQPMAIDLPGAAPEYPFPPKYGEHTDAILEEIGYDAARRERLRCAGVIV